MRWIGLIVWAILNAGPMAQLQHESLAVRAVRSGQLDLVRSALDAGTDPNLQDSDGLTLLIVAAAMDRLDVAELLLRRGADPNGFGGSSRITALMAAANGGHDQVTMLLLRAGADVNVRDHTGTSALMYAVDSGNVATVQVLLNAGADAQATDEQGRTAANRRRKTTDGFTSGCLIDGTLKSRYFSYQVGSNDPILQLMREAAKEK